MDQRNEDESLCAFCENVAKTRCTACLKVYYCSKEHQKLDWKNHAKNCSVLKLVKDTSGRKYYVATRNIKVGELVYEEKEPIVIGPLSHVSNTPSCLSCYIKLTKETAIPCKTCGWPLCPDCKTHGPECEFARKILNQKISVTDFEDSNMTYGIVIAARSLALKTANPSAYNKLLKLRLRTDNGPIYSEIYEWSQGLIQFLLHMKPIEDCRLEIELFENFPVVSYHGHMIPIKNGMAFAVYENVRYFKNDCSSNCTKNTNEFGGISIRAAIPISKGENVTICYVDPSFNAIRRRTWLSHNFIDCQCKRCNDPTEFGTMYNSVKCIKKDCDGYMLPPTFIVKIRDHDIPDFVCDKCSAKVTSKTVLNMIAQDEKEWQMLISSGCCNISTYKKILEKQRKILHEGHANIVNFKASILPRRMVNEQSLQQISDELLVEFMKYCKEVVENLKLLTPSRTRERGLCLFQLFRCRCEYSKRNEHKNSPIQNQKFRQDSMKIILECNDLLRNEQSPYSRRDAQSLNAMKEIVARIILDNRALCTNHM